jgi:hypothetical protein
MRVRDLDEGDAKLQAACRINDCSVACDGLKEARHLLLDADMPMAASAVADALKLAEGALSHARASAR